MAIIKNGRINIWNAVKKQFETVHPETETARITDFADGIVQKLALTSAMTAVTALQTDSWFGKLLKMALTASGVKYNIAQNGYICFGSFFGGLIIQWGVTGGMDEGHNKVIFPINFKNRSLYCTCTVIHSGLPTYANSVWNVQNSQMLIGSSMSSVGYYWMVIGY